MGTASLEGASTEKDPSTSRDVDHTVHCGSKGQFVAAPTGRNGRTRTRNRRPFAPKDGGLANRWAAEPPPAPQLGPHGLTWTGTGVRPLLAAIARDGVELLGGSAALRLRKCARSGCAIFFVDASRSGRRRWCSMAVCGNKAKVGAFRRRQRGERPTP